MASPVVETVATAVDSSGGNSITVSKPSGVANGDILLFYGEGPESCSTPWTMPSNWVAIGTRSSSDISQFAAYKIVTNAAGEPSSYTFTHNMGSRSTAGIARISGADTTTPIAGSDLTYGGFGTTPDPPGISGLTSDDYLACAVAGLQEKGVSWTPPTGYTEQWDIATTGGGGPSGHTGGTLASKAFTGTSEDPGTFTCTANDLNTAGTIIIAPVAAAPASTIRRPLRVVQGSRSHQSAFIESGQII